MKLETGMYVRTKKSGYIGKIYNINEFREPSMMYAIDIPKTDDYIFMGKNDFKASHRIIELIDIGDFVNGYKIVAIEQDYFNGKLVLITEKWETNWQGDRSLVMFHNEDICSVLTKEQYENISYKIEREED